MTNNRKICLWFMLFTIPIISVYGQQKYEKESRLYKADVPITARLFVDSLSIPGKIKWYMEEGLSEKSVEAKFKLNKKKHSIEFDTLGNIQDVEIQIKWKDIDQQIQSSIKSGLNSNFHRHKIQKIQIQYTGRYTALFSLLKNGKTQQTFFTHYELIVKGKKDNDTKLYEMTFNDLGNLLQTIEIIFKNSDNLEY